jgi:hypothetical protein
MVLKAAFKQTGNGVVSAGVYGFQEMDQADASPAVAISALALLSTMRFFISDRDLKRISLAPKQSLLGHYWQRKGYKL